MSAKLCGQPGASVAWPLSEEKLGACLSPLLFSLQVDRHAPRHGIVGIYFPKLSTKGRSSSSLEREHLRLRI